MHPAAVRTADAASCWKAQLPDRNVAALMLRLARSRDVEQWRDLLHTLMDVVRGPDHEELNRSLTAWLQYVARDDDIPQRQEKRSEEMKPCPPTHHPRKP